MLSNNLKNMTVTFYLTVLITLSGCGGDSTEESTASAPAQQNNDPVADMNALVATPNFTFTTKTNISVNLQLEQNDTERNHVNIYRSYQALENGRYYPNPASRVVSGALVNGKFIHSFIGLYQQQQYLIEIWTFDGSPPLQKIIIVNNNQLTW